MSLIKIPCCIIRGGTSKGIYIDDVYLPKNQDDKDRLLLSLFGSPDIRQIDGLGGADPLTSKLAIVSKSTRQDVDVEFLAAEIFIDEPIVNYGIMCGNTAAGVGYFALENGMVDAVSPYTKLKIYCHNNNKIIIAKIPVRNGEPVIDGDESINGVPGTCAATTLCFVDPSGGVTGKLLPTGNTVDSIKLNNKKIEFSLVDSGTLYAFFHANDLGIIGNEQTDYLDSKIKLRDTINLARQIIADYTNALNPELNLPSTRIKIAIVSKPQNYESLQGVKVNASDINIVSRISNPLKTHKAYAVSGAICLASAAAIPNTIPNSISALSESPGTLSIGHPSGIIDVSISFKHDADVEILSSVIKRTARILMCGTAYVKLECSKT